MKARIISSINAFWSNGDRIIKGDVYLSNLYLTELPEFLKDTIIEGNFNCSNNNLTSLKNSPKEVRGAFFCDDNRLTTLEEGPKVVLSYYYCNNNRLKSLKGCPTVIHNDMDCTYNELETLEGGPKRINGALFCDSNHKKFTMEYVKSLIDVRHRIHIFP